ncbi:hypothetical protein HMI55_004960 [Coelomomyces lativittatus]|nr:hypothetical protein HMI55_004960 [Coelomomyces lativittatus]
MTTLNLSTPFSKRSCVYFRFYKPNTKSQTSTVSTSPASTSKRALFTSSHFIQRCRESLKSPWTTSPLVKKNRTLSTHTEASHQSEPHLNVRAFIQTFKLKLQKVSLNPFKTSNALVKKSTMLHDTTTIHDSALVS